MFEALLDLPLWQILVDLARTPPGEDVLFNVYRGNAGPSYMVTPDRRILGRRTGGAFQVVAPDDLQADDFLRETLRAYFLREDTSAYALAFLLRDLPVVDGVACAQEITRWYKTFWIESLRAGAERLWYSTPPYVELAGFLTRFLTGDRRASACRAGVTPDVTSFPVVPANDVDYPCAIFEPAECRRFVELLDLLMARQPSFHAPANIKDEGDEGCDEWTREMIEMYRAIPTFPLVNPHLLSFIG